MMNSLRTTNWVEAHKKPTGSSKAENCSQFFNNQCLSNLTTDIEFISPSESSCVSEMIKCIAAKNKFRAINKRN